MGRRVGGTELGGVFRELDPPPGGRAALRERLGGEPRAAAPRLPEILLAAGAGVLAVAGVVWIAVARPPAVELDYPEASRPQLMSLGLLPRSTEAARTPQSEAGRQALLEISVEREGIALYWVSSLSESPETR